jgi:cysteinyl-tRNA synthetase
MTDQTLRKDEPSKPVDIVASINMKIGDFKIIDPRDIPANEVWRLINLRFEAKDAKDFAQTDRIRDYLQGQWVILEDLPDGSIRWKRDDLRPDLRKPYVPFEEG